MHGETVVGGLIAFSLLKKATVYAIARYYGFPKLYRKLVRANMKLASSPEQAAQINAAVKTTFRWPNRLAALWRHPPGPPAIPPTHAPRHAAIATPPPPSPAQAAAKAAAQAAAAAVRHAARGSPPALKN